MKRIWRVIFLISVILGTGTCISYEKYVSGLKYDYSLLNDPHYSSTFNQLLVLCRIKYNCSKLVDYKEYTGQVQPCVDADHKLAMTTKQYESPKYPGIILIPDRKVSYQNGCAFTYTMWNLTDTNIYGRAKLMVIVKLNSGEMFYGKEMRPLSLMRGFNGGGSSMIYNNIYTDDVESVKFVITELDNSRYNKQFR